jgi:hypothetical protein
MTEPVQQVVVTGNLSSARVRYPALSPEEEEEKEEGLLFATRNTRTCAN